MSETFFTAVYGKRFLEVWSHVKGFECVDDFLAQAAKLCGEGMWGTVDRYTVDEWYEMIHKYSGRKTPLQTRVDIPWWQGKGGQSATKQRATLSLQVVYQKSFGFTNFLTWPEMALPGVKCMIRVGKLGCCFWKWNHHLVGKVYFNRIFRIGGIFNVRHCVTQTVDNVLKGCAVWQKVGGMATQLPTPWYYSTVSWGKGLHRLTIKNISPNGPTIMISCAYFTWKQSCIWICNIL